MYFNLVAPESERLVAIMTLAENWLPPWGNFRNAPRLYLEFENPMSRLEG